MITAYGDADTKRKALENGAEAFFHQADRLWRAAQRDRPAGPMGCMTARDCRHLRRARMSPIGT
jgi:hypothetical protein